MELDAVSESVQMLSVEVAEGERALAEARDAAVGLYTL
jgi:hypothetical protein